MDCKKPVRIFKNMDPILYPSGMLVPCGKCLNCRIQKRKEWSLRMLHEYDRWDSTVFLTLTYDDNHLRRRYTTNYGPPPFVAPTLSKSDLQKFFKRLRRDLEKTNRNIKYYACGEYGDQTQRPHYHAIVYGIGLSSPDKTLVMDNWPFCDWNNQAIRNGSFGRVTPESIQYVAGYIDKKLSGEQAIYDTHERYARDNVFKIQSQGLGLNYVDPNETQMVELGYITHRGVKHSIPRYYLSKMGWKPKNRQETVYESLCQEVSNAVDLWMTPDELYKADSKLYEIYNEKAVKRRVQVDENHKSKIAFKSKKL